MPDNFDNVTDLSKFRERQDPLVDPILDLTPDTHPWELHGRAKKLGEEAARLAKAH